MRIAFASRRRYTDRPTIYEKHAAYVVNAFTHRDIRTDFPITRYSRLVSPRHAFHYS